MRAAQRVPNTAAQAQKDLPVDPNLRRRSLILRSATETFTKTTCVWKSTIPERQTFLGLCVDRYFEEVPQARPRQDFDHGWGSGTAIRSVQFCHPRGWGIIFGLPLSEILQSSVGLSRDAKLSIVAQLVRANHLPGAIIGCQRSLSLRL